MRVSTGVATAIVCFAFGGAGLGQAQRQDDTCRTAVAERLRISSSSVTTSETSRRGNGNYDIAWRANTDSGQASGTCKIGRNGRVLGVETQNSGGMAGVSQNGDGQRVCLEETARRLNLDVDQVHTDVYNREGNQNRVGWRTHGGRAGYCTMQLSWRVAEFQEEGTTSQGIFGNNNSTNNNGDTVFGGDGDRFMAKITGGGGDGKCTFEVEVDGAAEVEIRGDQGYLRTISGTAARWKRLECNRGLSVDARQLRFAGVDGRGRQTLVTSGGRAVVRIEDTQGGRESYTGDLFWK